MGNVSLLLIRLEFFRKYKTSLQASEGDFMQN